MQVQIKGTWNVTGKLNRRFDLSESETDPHRKSQTQKHGFKMEECDTGDVAKVQLYCYKIRDKREKIWKNSQPSLFVFLNCQKSNTGTVEEGICA